MRRNGLPPIFLLGAILLSCGKSAPEPAPRSERAAPVEAGPALSWQAPASWNLEKSAENGRYRAKYTIPAQGRATDPAELLITFLGAGRTVEIDKALVDLRGDFDAPGSEHPAAQTRLQDGFELHTLELAGTYKLPLGPKVGKRQLASVLKEHYRAIGVGVKTPGGELWFFRLVGPDDAVQAARSAFTTMLDHLQWSAR